MTPDVFKAFIKHASGNQDTPNDYVATKVAVMKMFPKLATAGEMVGHAIELGGLGILARPSIQKLRGKQVSHASEAKHELAGLGTLAAPSAYHLLTRH